MIKRMIVLGGVAAGAYYFFKTEQGQKLMGQFASLFGEAKDAAITEGESAVKKVKKAVDSPRALA